MSNTTKSPSISDIIISLSIVMFGGLMLMIIIPFQLVTGIYSIFKSKDENENFKDEKNRESNAGLADSVGTNGLRHAVQSKKNQSFQKTNIHLSCPACNKTSTYNNSVIRGVASVNCEKCSNKLKVNLKGEMGIFLTYDQDHSSDHQFNCPRCFAKLKIPQVFKKTEIRCPRCIDTFYVKP